MMLAALNRFACALGWLTIVLTLLGMLGVGNFSYYYGPGKVIVVPQTGAAASPAGSRRVSAHRAEQRIP